jgi:FtsP/CotA-like multicopper oxidase with cupredoxin domain
MKHRLLFTVALATVAFATVAAVAFGGGKGRVFEFRGELLNASSTSVQLQVDGGNHAALRALLGQSQNQSFTIDGSTQILVWSHGVPHVAAVTDLKQGDEVTVDIRAAAGSPLAQIESTPAGRLADHGTNSNGGAKPLWLYVGTVTGAQSGGHVALHVSSGNWRGLQSMLGQSLDQSFSYDDGTIFLMWVGKVPTVIDASQLKAGDRITIRVRAPRADTLAQVEAVPAAHIGDHEPGDPSTQN